MISLQAKWLKMMSAVVLANSVVVIYLLIFGQLPTSEQLKDFKKLLFSYRPLPDNFVRDIIMKAAPTDIMNSLARSVLTLYSYDEQADNTEIPNVLKQCFETYKKCIEELCDKILENNIELILCTPAPYDEYEPSDQETFKGGYALMSEYANFIRYFAKEKNYTLCDYYEKMVEIMQTDKLYNPDHIHPTAHGYYKMAEIFLQKQGLEIGEEIDIKQKYPMWNEAISSYRKLFIAECMVLKKAELSEDEKLKIASDYVKDNQPIADNWRIKWFVELCKNYLENRKKTAFLSKQIEEIFEKEVLDK